MFMLSRVLNHRLTSLIILPKRSVATRSAFNFGNQMKLLNDQKQFQRVLQLFDEHKKNNTETLSSMIITQALKACAQTKDLQRGSTIHHLISSRVKTDPYILTSLIHLYMQCGDVPRAESLFDTSSKPSLQTFGTMMKGYIQNNQAKKAIDLFGEIKNPDVVIIIILFNACAQVGTPEALSLVNRVSSEIPKSFYSNPRLLTSLIDGLMKCGDVARAQSVFSGLSRRTLEMYGAMMKGHITNNQAKQAIDLFFEITTPGEITITLFFNACAQLGTTTALVSVKKVLSQMPKSLLSNPRLVTSLLDALMKCGDIAHAQSLFNELSKKTVETYGVMMKGYIMNNQANKAIDLFNAIENPNEIIIIILFNACAQIGTAQALGLTKKVFKQIPQSFHSNPRILTSLVDALMNCGDVEQAQSLFDGSSKKSLPMFGAMMKGYLKNNQAQKAIDLFNQINNPDEVLAIILFNACAQVATIEALNLVKKVSTNIPESFYSNPRLSSSLLDALIKCGDCSSAESVFSKTNRSVIAYGNLMNGFNRDNSPQKTLKLFQQMQIDGLEPNSIIYLCVIKALSQIGDYSLCQSVIQHIPHSMVVDDQVHNALIDMWGKAGSVDRAKEVFDNISRPDQYGYTAMINSYGLNGMGNEAVELFLQMPPEFFNEVNHMCVLNACSHSGLVDQARSIFAKIPVKTDKVYTTMVDCLSRASMFDEAQALIDDYESDHTPALSMHMALLSGARNTNNSQLSQQVFDRMKTRFPESPNSMTPASILLANVYASSGEVDKASDIRIQLNKSGAKKLVGMTRLVTKEQVFEFRAHDRSHPLTPEIYAEGEKIAKQLAAHDHHFDASWITRPLHPDETVESALCGHSERLAIAFAFVMNPTTTRIQLTKNLRVCGDCHRATKLIAHIRQCEIIVRDANRIHHFTTNGQCSCNDYF